MKRSNVSDFLRSLNTRSYTVTPHAITTTVQPWWPMDHFGAKIKASSWYHFWQRKLLFRLFWSCHFVDSNFKKLCKSFRKNIPFQDLLNNFNTTVFSGLWKSGTGFSYTDWTFYDDSTTLSTCKVKNCEDSGNGNGAGVNFINILCAHF